MRPKGEELTHGLDPGRSVQKGPWKQRGSSTSSASTSTSASSSAATAATAAAATKAATAAAAAAVAVPSCVVREASVERLYAPRHL